MKYAILLLLTGVMFAGDIPQTNKAKLPDNPQPQTETRSVTSYQNVHVWTFRSRLNDPPLRSNKKLLKDPWFIVPQVLMWGSMTVACKRSKFTGEDFGSEAPAVGMVTVFSILSAKYIDELYAVGMAGFAVQHYTRASIEGPVNY